LPMNKAVLLGVPPVGVSIAIAIAFPSADSPMKIPPANPEIASDTLDRPSSWRALFATCS